MNPLFFLLPTMCVAFTFTSTCVSHNGVGNCDVWVHSSENFTLAVNNITVLPDTNSHQCLPGNAVILGADGNGIALRDLRLGQIVETSCGPEPVRAWLHRVPDYNFTYLEITTAYGALPVSRMHNVARNGTWAFAEDVRVGDTLQSGEEGSLVTRIANVLGNGLYSPYTACGDYYAGNASGETYLVHSFSHVSRPGLYANIFRSILSVLEYFNPDINTIGDEGKEVKAIYLHPLAQYLQSIFAGVVEHAKVVQEYSEQTLDAGKSLMHKAMDLAEYRDEAEAKAANLREKVSDVGASFMQRAKDVVEGCVEGCVERAEYYRDEAEKKAARTSDVGESFMQKTKDAVAGCVERAENYRDEAEKKTARACDVGESFMRRAKDVVEGYVEGCVERADVSASLKARICDVGVSFMQKAKDMVDGGVDRVIELSFMQKTLHGEGGTTESNVPGSYTVTDPMLSQPKQPLSL